MRPPDRDDVLSSLLGRALSACVAIWLLLIAPWTVDGQVPYPTPLVAFGIAGEAGVFRPADVDALIDSWLVGQGLDGVRDLDGRIELGFSSYLAVAPLSWIEIVPEVEYRHAPFFFLPVDSGDLAVSLNSVAFGASANLRLGRVRLGGGVFKHFAQLDWDDPTLSFSDSWKGNDYAYRARISFLRSVGRHSAFLTSLTYRHAVVGELLNQDGQILEYLPEGRPFELDQSSLTLGLGMQFWP